MKLMERLHARMGLCGNGQSLPGNPGSTAWVCRELYETARKRLVLARLSSQIRWGRLTLKPMNGQIRLHLFSID